MEEKPWLKSEYFAWHDGRRIVDLYELSKQLQCKQCRSLLDLRRTEREARFGLASVLYITCHCGVMNDVHTGRKQETGSEMAANSAGGGNMYEVNIKASINLLMYGVGASRFLSFLALLDIPVPPPDDTSLIVPVTDDSEMQRSLPGGSSSSVLPPGPPLSYNIPSGYSMPPLQTSMPGQQRDSYQLPHTSSSTSTSVMAGSGPDASRGTASDKMQLPQAASSSSFVPAGEVRMEEQLYKPLPSASADDQKVMYVPPLNESDSEIEPDEVRPSPMKSKSSSSKGTARRGRGRSRKNPPATKTSARKKKGANSSGDEFVDPSEVRLSDESDMESEADVKNVSDSSWRGSDHEKDTKVEENQGDVGEKEEDAAGEESEGRGRTPRARRGRKRSGPASGAGGTPRKRKPKPKQERKPEEADNAPKCPDCSKTFSSIKGYNLHMKRVHDKEVKETEEVVTDKVYVCSFCAQPFARQSSVPLHIQQKHDATNPACYSLERSLEGVIIRIKNDFQSSYFRCLKCGANLVKQDKVAAHIRVDADKMISCVKVTPEGRALHHGQLKLLMEPECREYLCHTCGMPFTTQGNLTVHMKNRHEYVDGRKKHACHLCTFSTNTKAYLTKHILSHSESRPRPFVCDVCGKAFLTKVQLANHKQGVHIREKKHRCQFCPKFFYSKGRLKRHYNTHSGQRPFPCTECSQRFATEWNLRVHQRIHTGEKPYQCKFCDAAFAQKNSLDVHMKKH